MYTNLPLVFNQKPWMGYPPGTPFELTGPAAAHLIARAMLKSDVSCRYLKLVGTDDEPQFVTFNEYLDVFKEHHPNSPVVTGPFVQKGTTVVDRDRLHPGVLARVTHHINYPLMVVHVCINDLYSEVGDDGAITYDLTTIPMNVVIKLMGSTVKVAALTVNSSLNEMIELDFPEVKVVIDHNW